MEADFEREFLETSNKILKPRTDYVRLLLP